VIFLFGKSFRFSNIGNHVKVLLPHMVDELTLFRSNKHSCTSTQYSKSLPLISESSSVRPCPVVCSPCASELLKILHVFRSFSDNFPPAIFGGIGGIYHVSYIQNKMPTIVGQREHSASAKLTAIYVESRIQIQPVPALIRPPNWGKGWS
jgi:hypothetical protein